MALGLTQPLTEMSKGKRSSVPVTGPVVAQRVGRGIALLMTRALEGGEWSAARPGRSLPRERPGTHCTGGWVGPRAGLDNRNEYQEYFLGVKAAGA